MMFSNPNEFSFENMDEESAKKALSILSSFIYVQDGGPAFLNQHLAQFGCTADGLINEILVDPELTRHELGQALHHEYRLHINPDDEDAAEYKPPARIGGKSAHPFESPSLYAPIHPDDLAEQALAMHTGADEYAGLEIFDEKPVEEQPLEEAAGLEASEQESSVADYLLGEEDFAENAVSDYEPEAEDFTTDVSDDDNSDDDDYVEKSAPKLDELTYEQQLALTIEASLKDAAPQTYNGEASGTNGTFTPPPSQAKAPVSPSHSASGKQRLPKSPHSSPSRSPSPAPVSRKRGRSTDDDDSDDDDKPVARPAKKAKKPKKSTAASTSGSSSAAAAGSSSSVTKSGSSGGRKSKSNTRKCPTTTSKPRRSPWTEKELETLHDCIVERRGLEAKHDNIPKLYDAPLWSHISQQLAGVYGINRAPGGCKSAWNRQGRQDFEFDERSALKRSASLATSVQTSKKDKKGKKPAVEDDEDDK
ncbi:hypothetical protein DID88_000672 [Monilinia fructigena]|uniref:Myb-like domain-containing protein n=1 Tax=Monilinia fructigena TaxID=38457 RepID=A0A395IIM8_9HELO|nr:hypothetical protein DID88_000672 [Monilinia fructigena]